ncbi:rod shape-determining protein RodA [gut metagenome]|uniref:peptidoglycan glycosyltransferase n=1 Tax=gut metagenome TaxID=749906 RepID=J9FMJ9_9ZZZZ
MINTKKIFHGDLVIWIVFFLLCMISLIEVYSAASTLSYKSGDFMAPLFKQAVFLSVGTVVVVLVHNIPCRFFKLIPVLGWPLIVLLLLVTLFLGVRENGGTRWISLFGFQFQPSELAKGVVITTTALILGALQREDGADRKAMKYIMMATLPICGLIVTENLSTTAILFGVVCLMMYIGRVPLMQLFKLFGVMLMGLVAIIAVSSMTPKDSMLYKKVFHRIETWESRIGSFVGAEEDENTAKVKLEDQEKEDSKDEKTFDMKQNAQRGHAYIAIASSNFVGRMPGNSVERDFLSQAFSDFIYAIIIEEMGVLGGAGVAFLYVVLLFRAGRIASRCERNFPAFLTMGLAILLVCQASINMMVAVGLFPVTGQPLPLISRGGSSTLITCAYIGMILSVSRYARKNKEEDNTSSLFSSGQTQTTAIESPEDHAAEVFVDDKGLV